MNLSDYLRRITQTLANYFGIELALPGAVWERISARHEGWLQARARRA